MFVVATANDVSQLPSELLRRGRFDELFFVDLPTEEEREDILGLYFQRYLQVDIHTNETFARQLVELTEGFTGADLESAVRELAYRKVADPDHDLTRSLALYGGYAFVEVYTDCCRGVFPDGKVAVIPD